MDTRHEKFDPGRAEVPVYPLPQRDPMRMLADWGMPPDPPTWSQRLAEYERPWISPGPPPAARKRSQRGHPRWAVACLVAGVALIWSAIMAGLIVLLS